MRRATYCALGVGYAVCKRLVGKVVADMDGERIGRVQDIIATTSRFSAPRVARAAGEAPRGTLMVPYDCIAVLVAPAIPLHRRLTEIIPYQPADNDILLARDVLDKQIIDTDGIRVVRVNDLELSRVKALLSWPTSISATLGSLRRLGLAA